MPGTLLASRSISSNALYGEVQLRKDARSYILRSVYDPKDHFNACSKVKII